MDKKTAYGILSGVLWGFLTSILTSLFPIGTLFAPGLLAIVGVRAGVIGFALAEAGYLMGSLLFLGMPGFAVVVECSLPALALVAFYKRVTKFETLVLTSGGALGGFWGCLYTLSLITGEDQIAAVFAQPEAAAKALRAEFASAFAQSGFGTADLQQINASFAQIEGLSRILAPALSIGIAMLTGLLAVLLVSRSVRRARRSEFVLPPFSRWRLPLSFSILIALMLAVSIVGDASGWKNFDAMLLCIETIFVAAYGLSGLAAIDALMLRGNAGKGLRIAAGVGLTVVSLGGVPLLVGLLDTVFGIRRRLNPPADPSA